MEWNLQWGVKGLGAGGGREAASWERGTCGGGGGSGREGREGGFKLMGCILVIDLWLCNRC